MAGRGAPSFQKRQKEQQRKEKQLEKQARKAERKRLEALGIFTPDTDDDFNEADLDRPNTLFEEHP